MIQKAERSRRWSSTGRTAAAGAGMGAAGGAITGALSLLGDDALSTGSALAFGVFYGIPFGALLGIAFGLVSGAVGGCLAMHVVRRHVVLARVVLTLCCALFIAVAAAWSLPPGPAHLVGTVLAGVVAAAAAWVSGPWCFRPLQEAGSSAV